MQIYSTFGSMKREESEIFVIGEGAEEGTLLPFLFARFAGRSKTTVKSYLAHRQVSVNGCITTQFDTPLRPGDRVEISFGRAREAISHPMLRIVYEDDDLIVVEKRNGLLSVATDKQIMRTAYSILSEYVKREDPRRKIFVLHRLDRETSGLMMFAKSEEVKRRVQSRWEETVVERRYFAVVEGRMEQPSGTISTYLTESRAMKVYVTNREEGKIAHTGFQVLKYSDRNDVTLLELELATGRKNQIRAHMEYVGHPIVGDKKYGSKRALIGRVALHAGVLSFIHPTSGARHDFATPIPRKFTELFE
ncbi:MAG: RluA family pseudouridine synthase [Rikenella sp.]|nr:RluA family pseudouridine synthase [Rikenella sp.]